MVAIPDSFFLNQEDAKIHYMLRAIDTKKDLSRLPHEDIISKEAWLASPGQYARRFSIYPAAIRATYEIAERLSFRGPNFGLVFPSWKNKKNQAAARHLREVTYTHAKKRYGEELSEPVVERIEKELGIIEQMGFASYFLIVRDIVARCPRTCGRGSGAASIVAYCLGITNVCPIKHNLYFERFLNPDRKDPPDIDIDFPWDERDDLLNSVIEKHKGHIAMVSNHVYFRPAMALREVARVYGLPESEISKISKPLPRFWRMDKADAQLLREIKKKPQYKGIDFPDPWPEIIQIAEKIIGVPRYLSVHPGGIVITPNRIDGYVPVQRATKGVPITQWEKDGVEEAGLVKIDLLGNRSLAVIRDAIKNVKNNDIVFDENHWEPEDDLDTQEALAQGKTMGCFYIESPAMRLLQQKAGVGDFEHLVIHSSIIRPAANEFIREYIRRLHGGSWEPIHPLLADVLDETFGIMVYQEDVSRAAVSLAGFCHGDAEKLRKVMSKKDRKFRLPDFQARFFEGAKAKGISKDQITTIWDMMMSFSGYSFCKPHSASYAGVSFQAAYLKIHSPAEFMAAVISNQGGFYSTFAYVSEARRMGLTILPPHVNISDIHWLGKGDKVRVGFLSIRGLSSNTMLKILAQREKGLYENLNNFLERVRPDETEIRALIDCGAFDMLNFEENRVSLLWQSAKWLKFKQSNWTTRSLFPGLEDISIPSLPPQDRKERLSREFKSLGFFCQCHPMELYSDLVKKIGTVKAEDLRHFTGQRVRFAGWLITGKVVHTKKGEPMEFLTFEDETEIVETTFFPKTYERFCHFLDRHSPYILYGKVEEDWGAITLTVDKVERLRGLD